MLRLCRNHKKGQIDMPVHLIFALVAGSIILLIFIMFAFKGFRASQTQDAIYIANTLSLMLTSTEVSQKTFLPIDDLPKSQLQFTCEGFSVNGQAKAYRNKIVFGPSTVTTTRLRLWSFDWNVPFYVTNMVSVSSPGILYVFVGELQDNLFKLLKETIPKNITTMYISPSQLSNLLYTGHEQTRFIYVNTLPQLPPSFTGKKATGLSIEGQGQKVKFLNRNMQPAGELPVTGNAMFFGAIFSDDFETYKCNVEKAYERLRYLARIYDEKQKYLRSNVPTDRSCTYNAPLSQLESNPAAITQSDIDTIKKSNHLLQQQSCPLIY